MKIAICYLTAREEPRLDWLMHELARQVHPGDEITLIVVDHVLDQMIGRTPESIGYETTKGVVRLIHAAPKPTPWSGPHRITSRDYWSKANTANTALVLCPPDVSYIVLMDDRSRPGAGWLDAVRGGYLRRDAVLAGAYERVETRDGHTTITHDHRLERHPTGLRGCIGGWLFGCSAALPLAWALDVGGFEEGCDGLAGEDYTLGLMLGNVGRRIDFDTELFVTIDRTVGNESCKADYVSLDKGISPDDKSHAALARFGGRSHTEFTPDLRALRALWHKLELGERTWPKPDPEMLDWFDGTPVCAL